MHEQEKPPVFKRWRSWYVLVMLVMLLQLAAYFLLTHYFA
jgi:hypothetical protein